MSTNTISVSITRQVEVEVCAFLSLFAVINTKIQILVDHVLFHLCEHLKLEFV